MYITQDIKPYEILVCRFSLTSFMFRDYSVMHCKLSKLNLEESDR
jgi:hypothetical protein